MKKYKLEFENGANHLTGNQKLGKIAELWPDHIKRTIQVLLRSV